MFEKYARFIALVLIALAMTYTVSFVAHATDNDNTVGELPVAISPVPAVDRGDEIISGRCDSPLDFNASDGTLGADGTLGLSDAVLFTSRYQAALGSINGDAAYDVSVDINADQKVNAADYLCAQPYYANGSPYSCQVDCANICLNPLDYNADYQINLSDAVTFTHHYTAGDSQADLNQNGTVDYGDYLCSQDQIALSAYQCPIQCAPVCGDAKVQARLGEQCDDGNNVDGDNCSATCKVETACQASVADYNHDGQITLADAVLFTPYYLNAQAEGDIDVNGETRLHDYMCMNELLNNGGLTVEAPKPLGIPTILPITQDLTTDSHIGSGGSVAQYNPNTVVTPVVKETKIVKPSDFLVGPLKSQTLTTSAPATSKKLAVAKPTVTTQKQKTAQVVLSAPAVKVTTPATIQPTVKPTEQKASVGAKVVSILRSIFVW